MDALCGKDKDGRPVEWVKEELLAESLHLHIKLVRKTLRFLEQVLLQAAALQGCLQVSQHCSTITERSSTLLASFCTLSAHSQRLACELREYKHETAHKHVLPQLIRQPETLAKMPDVVNAEF